MQLHTKEYGVVSHVASRLPCEVGNVRGYFSDSTDRWLQLHDAAQLPANTSVPLFSIPLYGATAFSWPWPKPVALQNGAVFAVSTTEATLTLSADTADFFVDGSASCVVSAASVVGNRTTAREKLDLVSAAALVYQVYVYDARVAPSDPVWVQLHNSLIADTAGGAIPVNTHKFFAAQGQREHIFNFGNSGKRFTELCAVASTSGSVYAESGANDLYIEAVYKSL